MRHAAAMLLASCLAGASAVAQPPAPQQDPVQWSVGVGVIASPKPYVGVDEEVTPVPVVGLRAGAFFFETVRMGVRVVNAEHFKTDILAQARLDGYEEDDSDFLDGMEERRMSADAGVRLIGRWRRFETEMTALTDALSRHDGQEVALGFGFPLQAAGWTITPGLGARWQSEDLADYYYGVEPAEAKLGRPAYEVGETVHPRAEVKFRKPFAHRRWMFLGQVTHEWLDSEVRDSPIVDSSTTFGGYFAFLRTFR